MDGERMGDARDEPMTFEALEQARAFLSEDRYLSGLGVTVGDAGPGQLVLQLADLPGACMSIDRRIATAMAEGAAVLAGRLAAPSGAHVTVTEMKVNFLSAPANVVLRAAATTIRAGHGVAVYRSDVTTTDRDAPVANVLTALVTLTMTRAAER